MNTRLEQVEFLFSYIFRKSQKSSRKIILSTSCGRRIQANTSDILFEQPTANFKELVMELEKDNLYHINFTRNTNRRLVNAYKKLCLNEQKTFYSVPTKYPAVNVNIKKKLSSKLKNTKKYKNQLLTENKKQGIAFAKFKRRNGI